MWVKVMQDSLKLRPFQKAFIKQVERPDISICALSLPRGNGKSTLCGWLAALASWNLPIGCFTPAPNLV